MQSASLLVGIGVMIFKKGKVLLARRKGSHGEGEYGFPGGHLEYGESFAQCARRETMEECGVDIHDVRFLFTANILDYMPKHYVHIGLTAQWKSGQPTIKEPDKSESWNWHSLDSLPEPLFKVCRMAFESYSSGNRCYDVGNAFPDSLENPSPCLKAAGE